MPRFLSWLAIAVAGAFLVVATTAFAPSTIVSLTLAVSIVTLIISAGVAMAALAVAGLTEHELSLEHSAAFMGEDSGERASHLSAAA